MLRYSGFNSSVFVIFKSGRSAAAIVPEEECIV